MLSRVKEPYFRLISKITMRHNAYFIMKKYIILYRHYKNSFKVIKCDVTLLLYYNFCMLKEFFNKAAITFLLFRKKTSPKTASLNPFSASASHVCTHKIHKLCYTVLGGSSQS